MNYLFGLIISSFTMATLTVFDFDKGANITNWIVVDDGVMGGRSNGQFELSADGHGLYTGRISLENNGGFSSLRHRFQRLDVTSYKKVVIRLKGDGKRYQFRIKHSARDYYSYIQYFETTGEWENIEIQLKDMYPAFRGRNLNMPNFSEDSIEEITFLIGNKKAESFELLIDKIILE